MLILSWNTLRSYSKFQAKSLWPKPDNLSIANLLLWCQFNHQRQKLVFTRNEIMLSKSPMTFHQSLIYLLPNLWIYILPHISATKWSSSLVYSLLLSNTRFFIKYWKLWGTRKFWAYLTVLDFHAAEIMARIHQLQPPPLEINWAERL